MESPKNKHFSVIYLLAAVIALATVFAVQVYFASSGAPSFDYTTYDISVFSNASESEDPSLCNSIYNVSLRSYCTMLFDQQNANATLCAFIDSRELRDPCYSLAALRSGNASLCERIVNYSHKGVCLLQVTRDISNCENMPTTESKDYCLYYYSQFIRENHSICDEIKDEAKRNVCLMKSYSVSADGLSIATYTESFLSSLRFDGGYHYRAECHADGSCSITEGESYPTAYPWAVLAYSGLYSSSKNATYLRQLKSDYDAMISIANSPSASQDTFFWGLVQAYEGYKANPAPDYLGFILGNGENLRVFRQYYSTYDGTGNPMILAIEARELAILYNLLARKESVDWFISRGYRLNTTESAGKFRENFLNVSLQALSSAETAMRNKNETFIKRKNFTFYKDFCWMQLAKLELYDATGDEHWLNEVESFFESVDFSRLKEENQMPRFNVLTELQPCADALLRLHKASSEQRFLEDAIALEEHMLSYSWDSDALPECNGNNGFLSMLKLDKLQKNCEGNLKVHTDNAYSIYLFSLTPDQAYNTTKWRMLA